MGTNFRMCGLLAAAIAVAACGSNTSNSQPTGSGGHGGQGAGAGGAAGGGGGSDSGAPTTYVLVHGGWHGPWAWDNTVPLLEAAGDIAITPTLPAHGSDTTPPGQTSLDSYAQAVIAAIESQDQNVVLVGHSMAGAIISTVAEARPERVRLLVYLAAVLLEDGKSVTSVTGNDPESVLGQHIMFNPDLTLSIDPAYAAESLYGDCSQADADAAIAKLGKEPVGPLAAAIHVTDAAWGSVPRIYIHTLNDKAIGPTAQETMYTTLPCQSVVMVQTSHSPFYCGAADFVTKLREAVAASGI